MMRITEDRKGRLLETLWELTDRFNAEDDKALGHMFAAITQFAEEAALDERDAIIKHKKQVTWNRVHFEPRPNRKYLVWWNTKQKGRFAIGEYRQYVDDIYPQWSANGSRTLGKHVEFWAELPDAPSELD